MEVGTHTPGKQIYYCLASAWDCCGRVHPSGPSGLTPTGWLWPWPHVGQLLLRTCTPLPLCFQEDGVGHGASVGTMLLYCFGLCMAHGRVLSEDLCTDGSGPGALAFQMWTMTGGCAFGGIGHRKVSPHSQEFHKCRNGCA